jgi:putative aldouronate transport system permease protein
MEKRLTYKKNTLKKIKQQKELLLILAIPFALYIFFSYVPYWQIKWAFTNFGKVPLSKVGYIGFANFERLLRTSRFWKAFINTVLISLYNLAIGFPIPIIFALLLNEMYIKRFKKTIQTVIYFPHFLSWVVIGSIWFLLLAPTRSVNEQISNFLGVDPVYWFARSDYIRMLLVYTNIWQGAGYSAIVYLAALSAVDPTLYEAAVVDGAGKFRQLWHVTLPGIRSTIVILFILRMGKIFNIFTQVIVMANEVVMDKADVIMTYAYRTGIQNMDVGYSMATSLFKAVITFTLVMLTNALSKKLGEEGVY